MRWRDSALGAVLLAAALPLIAGCGPWVANDDPVKIGRPYQVRGITYAPAIQPGYDAVGYASWYGREQGRGRTANGERFSARRVSGAHTTLPLPSYVEVTALDTGRTILVRLNDRGPFAAGRLIDLSEAAAEELGIRRAGKAAVAVRLADPPDRDRRRLRRGRPAALRPDAAPATLAMLRQRLAGYGAMPAARLSEPPQQ